VATMVLNHKGEQYTVNYDDEDHERIQSAGKWFIRLTTHGKPVVLRSYSRTRQRLERFLTGAKGWEFFHPNGDTLDCRRSNICIGKERVDLAGSRVGTWTVVSWAARGGHSKAKTWNVRCDCGETSQIQQRYLRGKRKSKGCRRCFLTGAPIKSPPVDDLTGQKFGFWTVTGRATARGAVRWNIRCQCGRERTERTWQLKSGTTKSCKSCAMKLRKERGYVRYLPEVTVNGTTVHHAVKLLPADRVGVWLLVQRTERSRSRNGDSRWDCICTACGSKRNLAVRRILISARAGRTTCPDCVRKTKESTDGESRQAVREPGAVSVQAGDARLPSEP
jgi:hypothetical protein